MLLGELHHQISSVADPIRFAEGPGRDVGGDVVRRDAAVHHEVEDSVDVGEGRVGGSAGVGEEDVEGGWLRGESGLGFEDVVEEVDGVVDGGDGGVGLEDGVVEFGVEGDFGGGGD